MLLRIIWSNAQVIPLSGEWEWWCYAPPFSYIRGSGSHISLENIVTVRYMYCRGAIIGTAKVALAAKSFLKTLFSANSTLAVPT